MLRSTVEWNRQFQLKKAFWTYDGIPNHPHALLTSDMHAGRYFNSQLVIPDEVLLRDAAYDLLELFAQQGGDISKVQGVVGPQTGATKLAEFISEQVSAFNRGECFWASPAKKENQGQKSMVFDSEDLELIPGQSILLCDDALTTSGSVELAATSVRNAGGIVLPFVLVLVNQSGLTEVGGRKIVELIYRPMRVWTAKECLYCQEGSQAVRPKDNWDRLNASY